MDSNVIFFMAYLNVLFPTTLTSITGDTTVIIPAGYYIDAIIIENSTANTVTGGTKIGTTNGGTEVAVAITVGANALFNVLDATILKRVFSMTVDTTLYIQAVVSWNSANLNFRFMLRKII